MLGSRVGQNKVWHVYENKPCQSAIVQAFLSAKYNVEPPSEIIGLEAHHLNKTQSNISKIIYTHVPDARITTGLYKHNNYNRKMPSFLWNLSIHLGEKFYNTTIPLRYLIG